jgi:hypothetical protein
MRLHLSLLLSLLAAAPPLAAQMAADDTGWHVGGGVEAVRFGHVAVSEAAPGLAAEVRPSGRPAVYLSVGRNYRSWGFDLEAGWAGGHVEAGNDALSIEDRTSDVSRYRLAIGINRRVGSAGSGIIAVALAPTLDLWTVDGVSRVRAGAEGRLVLRVPLGAVELENRIGVGFSGSPIEATDIGEVASLRGLRAVLVGVGLRFGLGDSRGPNGNAARRSVADPTGHERCAAAIALVRGPHDRTYRGARRRGAAAKRRARTLMSDQGLDVVGRPRPCLTFSFSA